MAACLLAASLIVAAISGAAALAPVHPHHRHLAEKAAAAATAYAAANPEACMCKNWKQAYASEGMSCGAGQEFFFKTGKSKPEPAKLEEAKQLIGQTICGNFYQKLDHSRCVNLNIGKDQGQWCYVDAACRTLNAGAGVPGTQLSWKHCVPGQDSMLRDLSPEDLNTTSRGSDLELGLLHKMSYPLSKAWENKRFPEVQDFWGVGGGSPTSLPHWLQADMKKIADTARPYSFDNSLDERTPHTIVVGMKVYQVEDSPDKDEARPGTWETLKCIQGC